MWLTRAVTTVAHLSEKKRVSLSGVCLLTSVWRRGLGDLGGVLAIAGLDTSAVAFGFAGAKAQKSTEQAHELSQ